MKVRLTIIGAGPAGLALANALLRQGFDDFLVLERASEAGGLCRSRMVDGSPLDVGGGHFLDVRRPAVTRFLFDFLPESEWHVFVRDSRIAIHGRLIGSPFEANIWQLDEVHQKRYLADIAAAGCNVGLPMPTRFVDWIYWKLGKGIAEDYMLPYNRKMFGDDLNQLGTYWLEKLPSVSYEETLKSCREHRPYAQQPGHATFYYPKAFGYGEVWRRMAEALGRRLLLDTPVRGMDVGQRMVNDTIESDMIVNTAPWTALGTLRGISDEAQRGIAALRHTSVDIEYVDEDPDVQAQWIYQPDPALAEHRWLVRRNFFPGARGYWKETRHDRSPAPSPGVERFTMDYAYPLNTIGKNDTMNGLLRELSAHRVFGLGRWGEWQHYNSDLVVERALAFAHEIVSGDR